MLTFCGGLRRKVRLVWMLLENTDERYSFYDVASWIGRFLLQWGAFELQIRAGSKNDRSNRSLAERFDSLLDAIPEVELTSENKNAIRKDFLDIRQMRNHITHGLIAAGVKDLRDGYIACRISPYSSNENNIEEYELSVIICRTGMLTKLCDVLSNPHRLIVWPDQFR